MLNILINCTEITAYPTLIFLNPDGTEIEKSVGFKPAGELLNIARDVVTPGKKFEDPYLKYDSLKKLYEAGNKNYSAMPYIIETALELNDTLFRKTVFKDYMSHFGSFNDPDLFTPDNITYISYHINSKSKLFALFYSYGSKVDSAMHNPGFSADIVDRLIQWEIVVPFLGVDQPHMAFQNPTPDNRKVNWDSLYGLILTKYNSYFAERATLEGKTNWFFLNGQNKLFAKYYLEQLAKYRIDNTDLKAVAELNNWVWTVFVIKIDDKDQLNSIIKIF